MLKRVLSRSFSGTIFQQIQASLGPLSLMGLFLFIEFFDELNYGVQGAALPAIRTELGLSYAQVGLYLGLPGVINSFLEPVLMLLGDTPLRRRLILGGAGAVLLALLATAGAPSFAVLLLAAFLGYPGSGAFVSLSQATLMDLHPGREAQMMARWTAAGSLGNLVGPLVVAGGFALAFGWRSIFLALAGIVLLLGLALLLHPFPAKAGTALTPSPSPNFGRGECSPSFPQNWGKEGAGGWMRALSALWRSLRPVLTNRRLWGWIVLLELANLLLDVLMGYTVLYYTDVAGVPEAQAGLLLSVMMVASLVSDLLVIPLLDRFPGRKLVRLTALLAIPVYAAWLLAPGLPVKILLMVAIQFTNMGWYAVLQGEAYAAAPGQSGAVNALNSLGGLLGGALVWLVGWAAGQAGLPAAMWLLILGPVSLVLFVPRAHQDEWDTDKHGLNG